MPTAEQPKPNAQCPQCGQPMVVRPWRPMVGAPVVLEGICFKCGWQVK